MNSQTDRILNLLLANPNREFDAFALSKWGAVSEAGSCLSFSRRIFECRKIIHEKMWGELVKTKDVRVGQSRHTGYTFISRAENSGYSDSPYQGGSAGTI